MVFVYITLNNTYYNVLPGVSGTKGNKGTKVKKGDQGDPVLKESKDDLSARDTLISSTSGTRKEKVLLCFCFFDSFRQHA